MIGVIATVRQAALWMALRMPGTARMGATETTGLEGQSTIPSARWIASSTPGAGLARDPVLLEADVLWAVRAVHLDPGLDLLVAHGHQPHRHAEPAADLGGGLAQGRALGEQAGAQQVGGDVTVAEAEPGRLAEPIERAEDVPGLAGETPAALLVGEPGEGVGDGVQVGGDRQPVQAEVVTGVPDDQKVGGWVHLDQPAQEPRGADPAGERDEHVRHLRWFGLGEAPA
jgi:hypothetical protein